MTHTKGKWTKENNVHNDFEPRYTEVRSGPKLIAKCTYGKDWNEHEANARLIAAAPNMLDALKSVNNYFIELQNKCALTNCDERAWKLTAKAIKIANEQ